MRLVVTIKEIKGHCPVYNKGDVFQIKEGYILDTKNSCPVCLHALSSLMPYYVALSQGVKPSDIGLSKRGNDDFAYVQCLDPCEYTGGGTVIFEVRRI